MITDVEQYEARDQQRLNPLESVATIFIRQTQDVFQQQSVLGSTKRRS
jgi:hypothetical protein